MYAKIQKSIAVIVVVIVLVSLTRPYGYSQAPERLQGAWINEKGTRKCDFYRESDNYFGKLLWVEDNSKVKVGDVIFSDLKWSGRGFTGKALTPRGNASCTITFDGEDRIKITASKGGMSKSVYWTRVQ